MIPRPLMARLGRVEWTFASIGCALLLWCGVVAVRAATFQRAESSTLDRAVRGGTTTLPKATHRLVGRLEIPRLKLSVMIADGDDEQTLKKGGGHLPDTPLPWQIGNSAIAGHRDTFFRPLQGIREKDRVRMVTEYGTFQYEVSRIVIVAPDDLSVLTPGNGSLLTLVTCYPFSYIGQAPKRFIVQARPVLG